MAAYTNLNLDRLANAALEAFVKELAPLSVFSTNFSAAPLDRARGSDILVPLIGSLTATTFGGSYAVSGGTKSVVTVTINKHKVVHIGQTDLDALDYSEASLESFGAQQGAALAQAVIEDVLTLVTTANFTSVTAVSSTVIDIPQIRSARLALNQSNAPKAGRIALADCVAMDALLAVTNFVQAHMSADPSVLREGVVKRAFGFDFYEMNSSFVSAASVNAFFGSPAAIAVAMRYVAPQEPAAYKVARSYADPKSGAVFGLRDYYDPGTGTRYVALECNFGKSAGITNAGRIVKRTD